RPDRSGFLADAEPRLRCFRSSQAMESATPDYLLMECRLVWSSHRSSQPIAMEKLRMARPKKSKAAMKHLQCDENPRIRLAAAKAASEVAAKLWLAEIDKKLSALEAGLHGEPD